jgi:pimeloyl-ACP methyl ester carboxylesterase
MQEQTLSLGDQFGGLDLGYLEWGAADAARTVVCVHGLTRNAHDFDVLAAALAERGCRVLAVDVAGRGRSGWLADPMQYDVAVYARHLARLLELLGVAQVDWVGTSMGGLIGMLLAAEERTPIERLVINDIGPRVAPETLAQIKGYLGLDLVFADLAQLEAHLRLIHAPFGKLSDDQWRALAEHSSRRTPQGLRLHYDPAIREPFLAASSEGMALWGTWDLIRCPTLVLHGADSVLLTADVITEMQGRGPAIELVTFPGVGHAPALMDPAQTAVVTRWLGL